MNKTIIAIDPGASGGIAWQIAGLNSCCMAMPQTDFEICQHIKNIVSVGIRTNQPIRVYLEDLVKHMGAGIPASTMAVYASNWGIIKGAVLYAGVRLEIVTPQKWQKTLGLGITGRQKADKDADAEAKKKIRLLNGQLKRDWKVKLKERAQQLYPHMAEQITLSTADAVLILEYGKITSQLIK